MISDSKLLASAAWDAQSLNELKAKAGEDPAANIRPVARQVEGMFVQMMLKSMRDALPKDGLFSSEHTRLYTSMYDQQIAQQMTAGKGLGLAEMMVKQMTPEQPLPEESTPADAPRDKCTLSCAINGIHAAFHYLKKNYISGCVMTVPT
ncbi:rod-binding protein, partial [Escherichia coli]|uniref:rod-binding protein n=1 Tax=Escherichia coli TaxID=562 RepID=UPI0021BF7FD5